MNQKSKAIIELAQSQMGYPYVYGAVGESCSPANRRKYANKFAADHPTIISRCPVLSGSAESCAGCKWQNARMFDCRGFTRWVFGQAGISIMGAGATSQWSTESNWVSKGTIEGGLPNVVCCLFKQDGKKMKHTGLHVMDGEIIHCSNNVQTGKITDAGWTHWAIPVGLYTQDEIDNAGVVRMMPVLKVGSRGQYVVDLQVKLVSLGLNVGDVDGVYGKKTEDAVKAFQRSAGLTADGIVGAMTWAVLNGERPVQDDDPIEADNVEIVTIIRDEQGREFRPVGKFTVDVQMLVNDGETIE